MKRHILYLALLAALGSASIVRAQSTTTTAISTDSPDVSLAQMPNPDEPAWIQLTSATDEIDAAEDEPVERKPRPKFPLRDPWVGTEADSEPIETTKLSSATLAAVEEQPLEEVNPGKQRPSEPCCPAPGCCPVPCCTYYSIATQRTSFFGDYLLLRARDVDMVYAEPRNGLNPLTSTPVGAVGETITQYSSGFRVGGAYAINPCSSIVTTFSWWQSSSGNTITTNAPDSIHSLVTYPTTASAAANSLIGNGTYGIRFRTADVEYRRLLWGTPNSALNYSVGLRYGHLGQNFSSSEPITPGTTFVDSRIAFDGAGPRLGLDGERRIYNGFTCYGRASASFLAGSFRSNYNQYNTFFLNQAAVSWSDGRIVPVLDLELGLGWASCNGRLRISSGYYVASWFNCVTQPTWIPAAQNSNFANVGQALLFDGLTSRLQYCF